jgi:predicted DNA-binding protein with PD1-like motif
MNDAGEIEYFGGHLISGNIWFTAEIVIEAVDGGIGRMKDPWSEVTVWKLTDGPEDEKENGRE